MTAKASIIICPGGAYRFLSPRESEPVARTFREMGFETEILRYPIREAGEPEPLGLRPLHALADAVKRQRDTHPGLPVYVCGFSAGAHLAATLGVHGRTLGMETPDALILCYPVITADERWCNDESFRNLVGEGEREFFSLEKYVSPDTPPVFLWHTAADEEVPVENSLLFAAALSAAGVPFELHVYPFGPHGLSLATKEVEQAEKGRFPDAHVAGWVRLCSEWLTNI